MRRIIKLISLTICLCLTIVFCSNSDVLAKAKPKLNKKSITVNVGSKSKLKVKNTKKKVKWKSKNTKIATVTAKGVVTGKQAGSTSVTAKVGKKKLTCKVTVKAVNKDNKVNVGDWIYTEHTSTVTINGYRGTSSDISVPASINGKKVIALSDNAFYGCDFLKKVVIPEGIVWYGNNVFFNCKNLESVQLPASLEGSFYGFSAPLFNGCEKLREIRVKKGSRMDEFLNSSGPEIKSKIVYY